MTENGQKAVSLFKYIRELTKLSQKTVTDVRAQQGVFFLRDIPKDEENITLCVNTSPDEEIKLILSVRKPELDPCPTPAASFNKWLHPSWKSHKAEAGVYKAGYRAIENENAPLLYTDKTEELFGCEDIYIELFEDNEERVADYNEWLSIRGEWIAEQRKKENTRDFFSKLFHIHTELERESDALELTVGNGILKDSQNEEIFHPILLRKVKTVFDAEANVISVEDSGVDSYIYSAVLQECEGINLDAVREFREELSENDYHPLEGTDTPKFLERFVHKLSPESIYAESYEPERWGSTNRFLLYTHPVFFVRKRKDGVTSAIGRIIENIEETGYIPPHLEDIVSGGKIDTPPSLDAPTLQERLAAVGGEDTHIFLTKEANGEQLEIAKRMEQNNAVLVQGPPGTGKTHTIANLLGHFLSQGKSVLVSSHTKKALRVLKEKVSPGLQNLCVSMLDDTNVDMERSVDGITDKMSNTTSYELKELLTVAEGERNQVISDLGEVRRKLFDAIMRERNDVHYGDEEISPSDMAKFVHENAEALSYIPGDVKYSPTLPLPFAELAELYRSNALLSKDEEHELICEIPSPKEFLSPEEYKSLPGKIESCRARISQIKEDKGWDVKWDKAGVNLTVEGENLSLCIESPSITQLSEVSEMVNQLSDIPSWATNAVIDGQRKGSPLVRWTSLISLIQNTGEFSDKVIYDQFENDIVIPAGTDREKLAEAIEKVGEKYVKSDRLSFVDKVLLKNYLQITDTVRINGKMIASKEDCALVMRKINLDEKRERCAKYWDFLFKGSEIPMFADLDEREPERIALTFIPEIEKYLNWFDKDYARLTEALKGAGIDPAEIFKRDRLTSDINHTAKILDTAKNVLPLIVEACVCALNLKINELSVSAMQKKLVGGKCINSPTCKKMYDALLSESPEEYEDAYNDLCALYEKYSISEERENALEKITALAPVWAESIRAREGVHGEDRVPDNIEDAWKWKQYFRIVRDIVGVSFDELHSESLELSKRYRELTGKCAEYSAWYSLLLRTECDIDMKQALQGWRLTVKKIGKGTGKKARAFKAKARELMSKCQMAVPAWIMTMNSALDSLDPKSNRFDILIVDEASQSDISALALTYLANKVIIVGDDRQVSPMAVGIEIDKTDALEQEYIKGVIPNHHLYNSKTSLYDIAATTFRPLMLREHFRCVPEIIGFSNKLSYNGKIKPLRDSGTSKLSPAVVSVRVEDGKRDGKKKVNVREAEKIAELIADCVSRPEYEGKSIGVISLLGDEQVKAIQTLIFRDIDPSVIEERRILCGNASNFQGDERDVIFLSMVDSPADGQLQMLAFGVEDAVRKRYNVAVSRAKDQLWIIHSLDPARDLKDGDIRKTLLDYAREVNEEKEAVGKNNTSERSELEEEILTHLEEAGYSFESNVKIGAYTLDTVVTSGKSRVAFEFDGKGILGSESRISEDMETQTTLERIGWRFIRIRGSEYYLDPKGYFERLIEALGDYGISPISTGDENDEDNGNDDNGDSDNSDDPPTDAANADMIADEVPHEVIAEEPEEVSDEEPDEISDEEPDEVSDEVPEEVSDEVPDEVSDEVPDEVSEETPTEDSEGE